ncbi:MAG TPA: amidase family protein [Myxococcota bacterium]|nr:amidase family protein [Myxococcota bacterium]
MANDLTWMDALGQAELVAKKVASPRELTEAAIARIEKLNPALNAVVTPLFEKARAQAAGDLPKGPFRGVPFLLKDLICATQGDPLYSGNRLMKAMNLTPPIDTNLAARYRAAGLVFLGKTATPEFGLTATSEALAYGPTKNPWDVTRSPGGSSGGSAAAVASGMVPAAHANDGGGSIRIPASANGIVGLKTSRGRISLGPLAGEGWNGLAGEHVVSRTVRDSAAFLDATEGYMAGDPYAAPKPERPFLSEVTRAPGKLRIGFMERSPSWSPEPLHPDCVAAVRDAAKLLESLGHTLETKHPAAADDAAVAKTLHDIIIAQTAALLAIVEGTVGRPITPDELEVWTWELWQQGKKISALDFLSAVEWRNVLSRSFGEFYASGYDLLLTPTLGAPPLPLGTLTCAKGNYKATWDKLLGFIPFTPMQNITGEPAISLPLYWNKANLPIGVQLVAPWGREDLLIRAAGQLEQARPWRDRRPPVHA